jgi:hypothetical protein
MSLLSSAMVECEMIDVISTEDGFDGTIDTYVPGAKFKAAISLDTSTLGKIAEHDGVTNLFTITTNKNVLLKHERIIRRLSDGKSFRITSDGTEKKTPDSATLNMRVVSAEEWRIPTDEDEGTSNP